MSEQTVVVFHDGTFHFSGPVPRGGTRFYAHPPAALPEPAQGWRPIESAPKDGTVLLACPYGVPGHEPLTYVGRWRRGRLGEPSQGTVAWRCESSGRFANPTHWMPLPADPAIDAAMSARGGDGR